MYGVIEVMGGQVSIGWGGGGGRGRLIRLPGELHAVGMYALGQPMNEKVKTTIAWQNKI